ncbi:MAG TPA: hypothetical protein VIN75_26495 [Burkholderiaceae bacterium]
MRQATMLSKASTVVVAFGALLSACGGDGGSSGGTAQSIDFPYPGTRYLATAAAPLSASATSGLTVTLTSNTPSVCTISDGKLVPVAVGECQVTATQDGDGSFAAAAPTQQLFKVLPHPQAITFPSPGFLALGAQPTTLTATSDSGLAVTYTSLTPTSCTVSGNTAMAAGSGQCTIEATQPGDANYAAAAPVDVTVNAGDAPPPTLTVASGFQGTSATTDGGSIGTGAGANIDNWWCSNDQWCWSALSPDNSVLTYTFVLQPTDPAAVQTTPIYAYDNGITINVPGLTNGISQTGNTAEGLQVANQTTLSFTLGENPEWFSLLSPGSPHGADVLVTLTLGHFNQFQDKPCNVKVQASVTPTAAAQAAYQVSLSNFNVVSTNCGLSGLVAATELTSYPIVQVQFSPASTNASVNGTAPVNQGAQHYPYTPYSPAYATVISVGTPILIQ